MFKKYSMGKSKKRGNKTLSITMILLLATVTLLVLGVNTANSQYTNLYPYITASPNPVAVNQGVVVTFGFPMPTLPPSYYSGWILSITRPDGTTITQGPFTGDSTGGAHAIFTPDKVGTYYLQANYPGGSVNYGNVSAQTTPKYALIVQQELAPGFQEPPLPTDYWARPIYGENREWYNIGGNWLMPSYDYPRVVMVQNGYFNPYTSAPNQAHVLWTKAQLFGGVIGGTAGVNTYYTGSSYRLELAPPVVIGGRLYCNIADPPRNGFYCIDLSTGETLWYQNQTFLSGTRAVVDGTNAQLTNGQVVMWNTVNQNGGVPYLWAMSGSTWARFDAWTGELLNTIVNCTSSNDRVLGPNGEILVYYLDTTRGTFYMWNSSRVVAGTYSQNRALNLDWKLGIQWNVSVATVPGETIRVWDPKNPTVIVCSNQSAGDPAESGAFVDIAYSATDGHLIWQQTRNEGIWERYVPNYPFGRAAGDGIYTIFRKETRQLYAYDINTGNKLWVSDPREDFWGTWNGGVAFAYGNIYSVAFDGMIYAYDAKTGKTLWTWSENSINPGGLETPYNSYPLYGSVAVADGKVFVTNGEHSANSPLYRGEHMCVVDAYTGQTVWSIDGWYQQHSIVDGKVLAPNGYDGKIYCFGKGLSEITVSAPLTAIPQGQSLTITGTITDQSPGQPGTPAISDESMSAWMEYIHMQKPMPTNATGVRVMLTVIDPNENTYAIANVTSDSNGHYGCSWTPPVPGLYKITATFAGTDAYGSSSDSTYLTVIQAPSVSPIMTPTTPPTPTPTPTATPTATPTPTPAVTPSPVPEPKGFPTTEMYIAIAAVVIIIAIAAVAVILRKHK